MSLQGLVRRRYKDERELELVYYPYQLTEGFEDRPELKVVMGHFRFGYHKFSQREARYFTFLRNPIDQVVSSYHYAKDFPEKVPNLPEEVNNLIDFAYSNYGYNFQTRFVAGAARIEGKEEETLKKAKENLQKHFAFVGITEEFDLSVLFLAKFLGWKVKYYIKRNKGLTRQVHPNPTKDELEKLKDILKHDLELYALGKQLFERHKGKNPQMLKRLKRFRFENKLFQKLEPIYVQFKKLLGLVAD